METLLFGLASVLALLSAGSLLAKNEGIRGAGRVIGGVSTICLGAFLLTLSTGAHNMPDGSLVFSALIVLTGLVTFASGARKFLRRHSEEPPTASDLARSRISGKPADETNGYTSRFERRPEFEVFGRLIQEVVDATTVRERTVGDLKVFHIPHLFSGRDEVFVGFGKPNTYLVCPDGQGGYQKYAGKSLKRSPSTVEATRDWVQSGLLIRIKNLPPHAAEKLREAMQFYDGIKFWTCVNACMHVMERAGFTSGKNPLSKRVWPYSLFRSLALHGLQFEGVELEYEVIRTTPVDLSRYGMQILKAELLTFCRHADRSLAGKAKKSKFFRLLYAGLHAPSAVLNRGKSAPRVVPVVAPGLPEGVELANDIQIQVSRASILGALLRLIWGTHVLFEARTERVNAADYLERTLPAFPQENPSLATRLKKRVLFAKPVIKVIRWVLCPRWVKLDGTRSERDVHDMLRTHSENTPNKYNLVITRTRAIVARVTVGAKLVDWILSKHVLMSGYDKDVVFAGEVWKDEEGVIHVSRNSGTYQPTDAELDCAVAYMQAMFPHARVVKDSAVA